MRASHFLAMAKPTQHTAPRRTYLLLLSLISLSLQLSFQNFPPGKNSIISRRPRENIDTRSVLSYISPSTICSKTTSCVKF